MKDVCSLVEEFNLVSKAPYSTEYHHRSDFEFNFPATVDAGYFPNGKTTWVCVVKDISDCTIIRVCKKEDFSVEPCVAKAMGVRWCLEIANVLNWNNILIRSDALMVADCIQGHSLVAAITPIVDDCLCIMYNFNIVPIRFVGRDSRIKLGGS